jgi:DNA polymerase III subunit alpha
VTVFPALYLQHKEMLQEDRIICVKARVEVGEREEEAAALRVVALDLSEPRLKTPEECDLFIDISGCRAERDVMDELRDILERHPGRTPVKLKLKGGEIIKVFRLPDELCVSPDGSLYAEVLSLLGDGCITLE